jgi:hypothetical protein
VKKGEEGGEGRGGGGGGGGGGGVFINVYMKSFVNTSENTLFINLFYPVENC